MPEERWKAFKTEYGKSYPAQEDAVRHTIFEANLLVIDKHNKKFAQGLVGYSKGLNQFSDWIPFTWVEANATAASKQNNINFAATHSKK